MVTSAPPVVVRVPHPMQAGTLPAALWAFRRLLSLSLTLGILWAVPEVVADYPTNFTGWVAGILAAIVGVAAASHALARLERSRVPGALRHYSMNEIPRRAWVPTVVSDLLEVIIVATVLPHLLSRSDGYGVLAGTLAVFGGAMLTVGVVDAAAEAWNRLPGWREGVVWTLSRSLPLGIIFIYAGIGIAPDPSRTAAYWLWPAIFLMGIGKLASAMLRPVRLGFSEGLDEVADSVTARINVAPTLHDRARFRALVRVAAVIAFAALLGLIYIVASR